MPRMEDACPPRGCLVLIERGASWPPEATRELRGSSSVVVVAQVAAEHTSRLWKRVAARCDELSSAGVSLTVTLLVCASRSPRPRSESRIRNAARLLALLPQTDSARLVLTADRPTKSTTSELLRVAAALVEGPQGTQVPIRIVAPSASQSAAARVRPEPPAATAYGAARGNVALEEQPVE